MDSLSLVPFAEAISVTAGGIYSTAKPGHSKITRSKNTKRCRFFVWIVGGFWGVLLVCWFICFVCLFLFQLIHLEFVSVLSDHFRFETTLNP